MRNIILSLLFFSCYLFNKEAPKRPIEEDSKETSRPIGEELSKEMIYSESLGDPKLYATNLPSFNDNLQCTNPLSSKNHLASYQPTTPEGNIYKEVVELIRKTLLKEERLLKPYLKDNVKNQRPADLLLLFQKKYRYKIPVEVRSQLKKLRSDFNKKIQTSIPYKYQYYRNGSNKVILPGLALALAGEGNDKNLARKEIATLAHLFSVENDNSRGVFHTSTNFWPNGDVVFHFKRQDDFKDKELLTQAREAVRWAAALWEEETAGTVRFFETGKPQIISAVSGFLYGKRYNLEVSFWLDHRTTLQGHASVGYLPFYKKDSPYNTMKLNTYGLKSKKDVDGFRFVALHEFGHVLGLGHEHERHDRDQYLRFTVAPEKVPTKSEIHSRDYVVRWKKMNIGNYSIALPYLEPCSQAINFRSSPYDYFSVMQYPLSYAYTTKSQRQTLRMKFDGKYRVVNDEIEEDVKLSNIRYYNNYKKQAFLSAYDVATVLELYSAR